MNIPYNGEFPIKSVFELNQLPEDLGKDGSRWLPELSDAQEYWQKSGQLVQMDIANAPLKRVAYFPTEKVKGEYDQVIKQQLGLISAVGGLINDLLDIDVPPQIPNCDFNVDVSIRLGVDACSGLYPYLYPYADNSDKLSEPLDADIILSYPIGMTPIADNNYNTINLGTGNNTTRPFKLEFINGGFPAPMDTLIDGSQVPSRIIPNSGTQLSSAMSFTQTIKTPLIPPEPIPQPPYLKYYEDILFPLPQAGIPCGAIYGYSFKIEVRTWNTETQVYDIEEVDYFCNLFYTTKIYFFSFDYLIKNNYFAENKLNQHLIRSGTDQVLARSYLSVIQAQGYGAFKGAFVFGGGGVGVVIEAQDSTILSELYIAVPIYLNDVNNNIREFIKLNYELYPMAFNIEKNELIEIPMQNVEALTVFPEDQDNPICYLLDSENYTNFNYFGATDGAYTVVAGGSQFSDNSGMIEEIIFILRNGKGWYNLKLIDVLDEQQSVDYFSYENGIIYIGTRGLTEDDPIKYFAIIPKLPYARLPAITYEFKKLGISFIPCQTHCMAKGGIVSKVY